MKKPSEAEVAAPVVAYLEHHGYDVYQEVSCSTGVCDIVALFDDEDWIIETKTTWSLDLLEQCLDRKRHGHRVFAAVPDGKVWRERAALFGRVGIGSIRVQLDARDWFWCEAYGKRAPVDRCPCSDCAEARSPQPHVSIDVEADWQQTAHPIRKLCRPEHKTHAKAGAQSGAGVFHWSEWRQTMQNVADAVKQCPDGVLVAELAKRVEHHYPNPKAARASIQNWAERGKVPGVACLMVKGRVWLFSLADEDAIRRACADYQPETVDVMLQLAKGKQKR